MWGLKRIRKIIKTLLRWARAYYATDGSNSCFPVKQFAYCQENNSHAKFMIIYSIIKILKTNIFNYSNYIIRISIL